MGFDADESEGVASAGEPREITSHRMREERIKSEAESVVPRQTLIVRRR
jgi:hypothetical protein